MDPIESRRIVSGALLVAVLFAPSCSRSRDDGGKAARTADAGRVTWTLPEECESCLRGECDSDDTGFNPYGMCVKEPTCVAAFASMATCFGHRQLAECGREVDTLKRSGRAGGELLACLMHSCFVDACELARATENVHSF